MCALKYVIENWNMSLFGELCARYLYYEAIVDDVEGQINYDLVKIKSEVCNCFGIIQIHSLQITMFNYTSGCVNDI